MTPAAIVAPDVVVATVRWRAEEPLTLRTIVAGVELHARFTVTTAGRPYTDEQRFEVVPGGEAVYEVPPRDGVAVLTGARLVPGEPGEATARLAVPMVVPSVRGGRFLELEHSARVDAVDAAGTVAATARAPFRILLPRGGYDAVTRTLPVATGPDVGLAIDVPERHLRPGAVARGTVACRRGGAVRLELLESWSFGESGRDEQERRIDIAVASTRVRVERGGAMPFELPVPDDARPTCFTDPVSLRWLVRARVPAGHLAVGRRSHAGVEVELSNG